MPTTLQQIRTRARSSYRRRSECYEYDNDRFRFNVGPMNIVCSHCGAHLWINENKALCCANGQVRLPPIPEAPPVLRELLTENSARSKSFRERIRAYNASST